jgi:hypothetical protein
VGFNYQEARYVLMNMSPVAIGGDYIYESCRLAALIMIMAIDSQRPFGQIETPLLNELKLAIQKTDIDDYWGMMAGVLFWIALVGCASALGKPQQPFFHSLIQRGELAFSYKGLVFQGSTIAAHKFQRMHIMLKDGEAQSALQPWPDTHYSAFSISAYQLSMAKGERRR